MDKRFQNRYLLLVNSLLSVCTCMLAVLTKNSDMSLGRAGNKLVVTLLRNDELIGDIHLQIGDNHGSRRDHVNQVGGVVHVLYSI